MAARFPSPVVMRGRCVRLEPLAPVHVPDLQRTGGGDDEVWRWLPTLTPGSEYEMRMIVEQRLAQQAAGEAVLFAVIEPGAEQAVGWTAYLDISPVDERVGIGWYWLARRLWDTFAEVETHLLMMRQAFEVLGYGRVQWQVDHLDQRSHAAITHVGGRLEGRLRRHVRRLDGTWRDTMVYAVLAPEWPSTRDRVLSRLILD